MGKNISENDIIKNMEDAGCDEACIRHFLKCFRQGNEKEELETLANHRDCILDKLHEAQREIDCLDYLVSRIEKQKD